MNHRIKADHSQKKTVAIKRDTPVAPAWPSYQGTSQFVGTSPSGRVHGVRRPLARRTRTTECSGSGERRRSRRHHQ